MKALNREMECLRTQGRGNQVPDGAYIIPHPKIVNYYFQVIASTGEGWDHVSACLRHRRHGAFIERCPNWPEMCFLKDFFFDKQETVIQYHPAESDYVNTHPWVLHLWRPQTVELPVPATILV